MRNKKREMRQPKFLPSNGVLRFSSFGLVSSPQRNSFSRAVTPEFLLFSFLMVVGALYLLLYPGRDHDKTTLEGLIKTERAVGSRHCQSYSRCSVCHSVNFVGTPFVAFLLSFLVTNTHNIILHIARHVCAQVSIIGYYASNKHAKNWTWFLLPELIDSYILVFLDAYLYWIALHLYYKRLRFFVSAFHFIHSISSVLVPTPSSSSLPLLRTAYFRRIPACHEAPNYPCRFGCHRYDKLHPHHPSHEWNFL